LFSQCVRPRVARDIAEADATRLRQAPGTQIDGIEEGDWCEPGRPLPRCKSHQGWFRSLRRAMGGWRPRAECRR
jgi:hypothetical protein